MPIHHKVVLFGRWYVIPVGVDADGMFIGEERTIKPFWEGEHPWYSTFGALGSTIYRFGPDDDVFKLDPMTDERWIRAPSMNTRRSLPHKLALGSKLYVLGSDPRSKGCYAEVFDPVTNKWVALPDPPYQMSYFIISAALENPNRILVASQTPESLAPGCSYDNKFAVFFVYDVGHGYWKMLEPARRKIHRNCPIGWGGMARAAGSFLYWITEDLDLLCYDLDLDMWLLGELNGIVLPHGDPFVPVFVHLENHRFCILQCPLYEENNYYIQCKIVDVTRIPEEKRLGVSVVWSHQFKTDDPTTIRECCLL